MSDQDNEVESVGEDQQEELVNQQDDDLNSTSNQSNTF